jgi:two-component system sensor histidine kinase KdpD
MPSRNLRPNPNNAFIASMDTQQPLHRNSYFLSAAIVGSFTAVLTQLPLLLEHSDIALLYLLVVLISATTFGRGPAIFTSFLAFLCSNFFFVEPRYTLVVANPQDVLQLLIFLIVAIVSSELAGRVRNQAMQIVERARELTALYTLSQSISADVDLDRILPVIASTTCTMLSLPSCSIFLYNDQSLRSRRGSFGSNPPQAVMIDTPIQAGARILGVLQVTQRTPQQILTAAERERLALIANQIALVVERAHLADEVATTRGLAESDRLKSVLLSSVSHDLRTPLAIIKGAVTNLLDDEVGWDASARQEFLQTINESTDRLNRLVGNVLEMSRIEAGALSQTRTWEDLGELLDHVVRRMQPILNDHPLQSVIAPDLPLVHIHTTQIEQVLTNLIENAVKHTPIGTPITIMVSQEASNLRLVVQDSGPGIQPGMLSRIFDRFVRVTDPERHAEGSGLGLAIAKGLVEAHRGHMWAEAVPEGGARFVMLLPISIPKTQPEHAKPIAERI